MSQRTSSDQIINLAKLEIEDYESVRERIVVRAVNKKRSMSLLKDTPHLDMLDLTLFCYIDLGITDDGWTQAVRVRKRHLELWDITKARLFDDALENTPHCLPPLFAPLDEVMTGINENYTGDFTEDGYPRSEGLPLSFILTNMRKRYGACTLFYPGLLEEVYSKIGAFYILPGSIHELFLIRDKEFIDPEGLAKVVMDVNQCEEMIPEYLSDHLYYYGGKDVPLQIVSDSCGFSD